MPAHTLYMWRSGISYHSSIAIMERNKEFAVLVGRAFLREVEAGHKESAVAFGRAFLLSLGMRGPDENESPHISHGKDFGEHLVLAHD